MLTIMKPSFIFKLLKCFFVAFVMIKPKAIERAIMNAKVIRTSYSPYIKDTKKDGSMARPITTITIPTIRNIDSKFRLIAFIVIS